jgi:hypothetical protein
MNYLRRFLSLTLSFYLVLASLAGGSAYAMDEPQTDIPIASAQPTPQELQQLVAPIALYPDSLVAQILAASTYPAQIVEANRWLQANPELKGDALAKVVDQQPWDPSVKALAEFPSVLSNMDKNLSWTSSLGEAYINHQQDVMNAVQEMRKQAKKAGHLESTSQSKVTEQGQTIVIEPADPEVVYVPEYDPWLVYGVPVAPWPGWYWYPGLYWTSPGFGFGLGFHIGFFAGFGWGWHGWAPDWHHNTIIYNHATYFSHSTTVINRNYYGNRARKNSFHGAAGGFHGENSFHGAAPGTPHAAAPGGHSGAFSGFHNGGVSKGYASRGFSSMGGFHGAGSVHGGGGRR